MLTAVILSTVSCSSLKEMTAAAAMNGSVPVQLLLSSANFASSLTIFEEVRRLIARFCRQDSEQLPHSGQGADSGAIPFYPGCSQGGAGWGGVGRGLVERGLWRGLGGENPSLPSGPSCRASEAECGSLGQASGTTRTMKPRGGVLR